MNIDLIGLQYKIKVCEEPCKTVNDETLTVQIWQIEIIIYEYEMLEIKVTLMNYDAF